MSSAKIVNDMKQQEKQLLLKDLCARLPYGVMANHYVYGQIGRVRSVYWDMQGVEIQIDNKHYDVPIEELVVYLRPMSSMTEEEEKVFNDFLEFQAEYVSDADLDNKTDMYDWLNAHHFDYRIDPSTGKTLIESNLAIEAPEGMYKTE